MKFVADESVDGPIVRLLRREGHEVWSVAERAPSAPDSQVLRQAAELGWPLVTSDRDFGDLVIRMGLPSRGVVFLRLGMFSAEQQGEILADVVRQFGDSLLDQFVVVEPNRVRFKTHPEER